MISDLIMKKGKIIRRKRIVNCAIGGTTSLKEYADPFVFNFEIDLETNNPE